MNEVPVEKRFAVLSEIARAQHFAWREAVRQCCPDIVPSDVVNRMWRITGEQTASGYLRRIDPSKPLAPQLAHSFAWSSQCMGEDVVVEEDGNEARLRHQDCPCFHWHKRLGLLDEDRPGCDLWFATVVNEVNQELGTDLRFETLETLPDGGDSCLRRFWVDESPQSRGTAGDSARA